MIKKDLMLKSDNGLHGLPQYASNWTILTLGRSLLSSISTSGPFFAKKEDSQSPSWYQAEIKSAQVIGRGGDPTRAEGATSRIS